MGMGTMIDYNDPVTVGRESLSVLNVANTVRTSTLPFRVYGKRFNSIEQRKFLGFSEGVIAIGVKVSNFHEQPLFGILLDTVKYVVIFIVVMLIPSLRYRLYSSPTYVKWHVTKTIHVEDDSAVVVGGFTRNPICPINVDFNCLGWHFLGLSFLIGV